jgi:hypothetical protein
LPHSPSPIDYETGACPVSTTAIFINSPVNEQAGGFTFVAYQAGGTVTFIPNGPQTETAGIILNYRTGTPFAATAPNFPLYFSFLDAGAALPIATWSTTIPPNPTL